jgi:uncharacterized protein
VENAQQKNIAKLKHAYRLWNETRGGSVDEWTKLFTEDIVIHPPGGYDAGSGFFREFKGRDAANAYFSELGDCWEMIHFTPEQFIAEGDLVVVLSRVAFRCKSTGKTAASMKADFFLFRNGAIAEFRDFFDTACVLAAQGDD